MRGGSAFLISLSSNLFQQEPSRLKLGRNMMEIGPRKATNPIYKKSEFTAREKIFLSFFFRKCAIFEPIFAHRGCAVTKQIFFLF
jgi:hypothetical protein